MGRLQLLLVIFIFAGSPPDKKIFHELAELRIFLAREISTQMVPVEKPNAGLNEMDMLLRRELKLTYLAGIASLTIDQAPLILDRAALDLDLYAKPAGATVRQARCAQFGPDQRYTRSCQTGVSKIAALVGLPVRKRAKSIGPTKLATQPYPITHQIKGLTAGAFRVTLSPTSGFKGSRVRIGCFHEESSDNSPTQPRFS